MSKALLKQSLELMSFEPNVTAGNDQRRKKIKSTGNTKEKDSALKRNKDGVNIMAFGGEKKKKTSSGTLDLIPMNHRLITKNKKKGSKALLSRTSKLSVYEAKKQLQSKPDPVEENVRKLLFYSNCRLDTESSTKILTRGAKKRYIVREKKPVEEQKTVFTEEDFQKFEKEYFGD